MERDAMMVFRLPTATRKALQRAAKVQQRSMSNMALRIVSEWLSANGYLARQTPTSRAPKKGG
jgi:uncharacterized protein (DUF1778 family)